MKCTNCGVEISGSFRHAIQKNECPSCGKFILDEETLALIEDIENTIRSEAAIREETARNIAVSIVTRYNITFNGVSVPAPTPIIPQVGLQAGSQAVPRKSIQHKIAPPSIMAKTIKRADEERYDIISPDIPDDISDEERDRIFEEAVKAKYNTVDQTISVEEPIDDINGMDNINNNISTPANSVEGLFSVDKNDILEKERLERLARQKRVMNGGGGGAFRRSND